MKETKSFETYHEILKWWSMIRWFIVIVLFSVGMLQIQKLENYLIILYLITFLGTVVLNLFFHIQIINANRFFCFLQIILDILFVTIIVHLTGGISSPFVWSYLLAVITASLTVERSGGFLTSLIGSMTLLSLFLLYYFRVIEFLDTKVVYDVQTMTIFMLSYTSLFSGVAFIANYISDLIKDLEEKEMIFSQNESEAAEKFLQLQKEYNDILKTVEKNQEMTPILKDIAHLDHDINTPLCVITLSLTRVKQAAASLHNEFLAKSSNEITEAVNNISELLKRLIPLKEHDLLK
jgi:signal transduction histidine kinase